MIAHYSCLLNADIVRTVLRIPPYIASSVLASQVLGLFDRTTILAPTFLAAANFIILGTIINRVGPQYSRMPAKWCKYFNVSICQRGSLLKADIVFCVLIDAIIFVSVDVLSLVVQAIGGGVASRAVQKANGHADKGGHIMLGKHSTVLRSFAL